MVKLHQTSPSSDILKILLMLPIPNTTQQCQKHNFHTMDARQREKYISMLALKVKYSMGIKPSRQVTSVKRVSIPRRAIVSGITLVHRSHDEGKNKEGKEMVHARELKLSD